MLAEHLQAPAMKPSPFNIRLSPEERAALDAAGNVVDRPSAWILRDIARRWLREQGFLNVDDKKELARRK
jgi:predicted DNA-binding protein